MFSHPNSWILCKQVKHCYSTTIALAPTYYWMSVGKDWRQRTAISPSGSLDHYYSSEPITPQSYMAVLFFFYSAMNGEEQSSCVWVKLQCWVEWLYQKQSLTVLWVTINSTFWLAAADTINTEMGFVSGVNWEQKPARKFPLTWLLNEIASSSIMYGGL